MMYQSRVPGILWKILIWDVECPQLDILWQFVHSRSDGLWHNMIDRYEAFYIGKEHVLFLWLDVKLKKYLDIVTTLGTCCWTILDLEGFTVLHLGIDWETKRHQRSPWWWRTHCDSHGCHTEPGWFDPYLSHIKHTLWFFEML